MKIYKITNSLVDVFGDDYSPEAMRERAKHRKTSESKQKPITLTLYRGFNYLPKPNQNGTYTLSPENSEQESLWFTHDYIHRSIDPLEYAQSHGKYLLTYPLKAIKHYQTISYDDNNETYDIIPEEINKKTNGLENCKYYSGIELPDGWFFSYKTEKFIISTIPIIITKGMIS